MLAYFLKWKILGQLLGWIFVGEGECGTACASDDGTTQQPDTEFFG